MKKCVPLSGGKVECVYECVWVCVQVPFAQNLHPRSLAARIYPVSEYKLLIEGLCHREMVLKAKWLSKLPHERAQNQKQNQKSALWGPRANKIKLYIFVAVFG